MCPVIDDDTDQHSIKAAIDTIIAGAGFDLGL